MTSTIEQLVEQIHAAPEKMVLALSGGGSRALAELLEVPGASRTLLEAVVPYSETALIAWLGGRPDQFCSPQAGRAMAMAAFRRACEYCTAEEESALAGIACTAGLTTDRPRRGSHRAHVAMQTATRTVTWSVELEKDLRTRREEEQLVCRLLLNAVAEACEIQGRLELSLAEGEQVERSSATAGQSWQDLLLGKVDSVCRCEGERPAGAIFPGAFNPLHVGHRRMAEIAREMLGVPIAMEISIFNVDKPPLDYFEIERRVNQFAAQQPVWLSRAATFEEKSRLFPGATFVVGTDTLRRIADPYYHGNDPSAHAAALRRMVGRRCRFLVFGRNMGTGFVRMSDLELPDVLRAICREVPAAKFREDVSSTQMRKGRP